MGRAIGGMEFVRCTEIVRLSESPLLEVSLYTHILAVLEHNNMCNICICAEYNNMCILIVYIRVRIDHACTQYYVSTEREMCTNTCMCVYMCNMYM